MAKIFSASGHQSPCTDQLLLNLSLYSIFKSYRRELIPNSIESICFFDETIPVITYISLYKKPMTLKGHLAISHVSKCLGILIRDL